MERRNRRVGDERMIKCRCGSEAAASCLKSCYFIRIVYI